jgi:hypothetical protein
LSQGDFENKENYTFKPVVLDNESGVITIKNDYYVVEVQPTESSLHYHNQSQVTIYFADKIAELVISAGLVNWVVEMTG